MYAHFAFEATQLKKKAAECDGRQEVCVEGYLNKNFIKIVAKLDSLTNRVESVDKNRIMAVYVQRMRKY